MSIDHACFPIRSTASAVVFAVVSTVGVMSGARANAQPGTVLSHQKISDAEGGFAGMLDNEDQFGVSVASLGDLDGDGVLDVAVGVDGDGVGGFHRGALWVLFLDTDGTVKSQQRISASEGGFAGALDDLDFFGRSETSLGDLDNDGVGDIAVGAPYDDDGGLNRGAVWVLFLHPDGTVKSHQKISDTAGDFAGSLDDDDIFGFEVASIGDLDGDGVVDLCVGAAFDDDGGDDRGAVWVLFLDRDGTVRTHQKISGTHGGFKGVLNDGDLFGISAVSLGDIDGDGVGDLSVGGSRDDDGGLNRGAVWVLFLHPDGTVKSHQKISDTEGGFTGVLDVQDQFGVSVAGPGDLDGDGVPDLVVGANGDDDGGGGRGAVWVLFLNPDGAVRFHQKISDIDGGFKGALTNQDEFGVSAASLGDFNGDGVVDLAVGARGDDDGGVDRGAIWVVLLDGTCPRSGFVQPAQGVSAGVCLYDGFIDARRESVDGMTLIGLDSLHVCFATPMENNDGSPLSADAFFITDTAGTPPSITGITTVDGQTVTVELSGPITLQEWTTLTVHARSQCDQSSFDGSMDIGYLPADVNQDARVDAWDLLRFKQYVYDILDPPLGVIEDFVDINRDGIVNPLDLLSFRQLINGVSPPATQAWAFKALPPQP